MDKRFAVKSNYFSLYEAFKKEVEGLGFTYKAEFTEFEKELIDYHDCLFFCNEWDDEKDKMKFSLSNAGNGTIEFDLETQWKDAIAYAKKYASFFNPPAKRKKIRVSVSKLAAKYGVKVEDVIITS